MKKQPITNDNKNINNRPANLVARFVSRARQFLGLNRTELNFIKHHDSKNAE